MFAGFLKELEVSRLSQCLLESNK